MHHLKRSSRLTVCVAAVFTAQGLTRPARAVDVSLYEPFNYPAGTQLQIGDDPANPISAQSPDGIRSWKIAGAGGGDATTGRPHAASPLANLPMPSAMPAATGNEVAYGGNGSGT